MIYKFKLVSDEVNNFAREIEIDSNASFLQLRNAILDSVDYSREDYDSFFLCNDEWEREEEIALEDEGSASDQDIWIMEDTPLNELIEEDGQKLVFAFDYTSDRCFFMEMVESVPGRNLSDPICTLKRGKAPSRYIEQEEIDPKTDVNNINVAEEGIDLEDIYDDTQYDDEEISSGFDIENC